jgi:tetratricopeptide (TPR) repeat protein
MDETKSTAADKSNAAAKAEPASVTPKPTMIRRRANVKIVQNVLLIWLDANIDEDNDADCQNTITQLQHVVNNVNTFTNGDQCIEFIETIDTNNNKACMIISGSLGQQIVPRVHKMSQVDSIFIFCSNKKYHEQWTKDWAKIKGVFTEISPICEALKKATQQCEHNATPISFMATSGDDINQKKLDQLDCSFMYTQILKDILLTITFEPKHIQEYIEYCREQFADIEKKLTDVEELERDYHKNTPVWWYTCESFLYPMLNSALRLMDVGVMIKMGFFITDLHRQIQELHTEQFDDYTSATTLTVYRGQGMSEKDFQQMTKTKGGLMAFNSFLSTSKVCEVSLNFARRALSNPDIVGILFVMTIDPSQSATPFASINDVSFFKDREDEVLFSMHAVFRIRDIKSMDDNDRLYEVNLTLTNDNDKDLCALTDHIGEEMEGSAGWDRLGQLLLKIRQSEKAEQVYEILLKQATNEIEIAYSYFRLGWAKDDQGEYKEALVLYEKSLAIRKQLLPPNHLDLTSCYGSIGGVYSSMGEYSKALSYYEKALAIRQQSLPPNHPDLASSYGSIGGVYSSMGEYSKALSYYEKALAIRQQSLPPNHPDLASSYGIIGGVYHDMGEYSKVVSYYEKAVAIRQQSLPPTHPDLATSYNNIGGVYEIMGEYSKALLYYEKTFEILQQSLPPNHPDLATSYNNIGNVYGQMGEYSKALSSHEKALVIKQQSLPPNHPDLASSYNNIGGVYENLDDYSKARLFYERAVDIAQQSLSSNHPSLQRYSRNLDRVKKL